MKKSLAGPSPKERLQGLALYAQAVLFVPASRNCTNRRQECTYIPDKARNWQEGGLDRHEGSGFYEVTGGISVVAVAEPAPNTRC